MDRRTEVERDGCRRDGADPTSLPQTRRTDLANIQTDGRIRTLKTLGKPKGPPVRLHEAPSFQEPNDELKVDALTPDA